MTEDGLFRAYGLDPETVRPTRTAPAPWLDARAPIGAGVRPLCPSCERRGPERRADAACRSILDGGHPCLALATFVGGAA